MLQPIPTGLPLGLKEVLLGLLHPVHVGYTTYMCVSPVNMNILSYSPLPREMQQSPTHSSAWWTPELYKQHDTATLEIVVLQVHPTGAQPTGYKEMSFLRRARCLRPGMRTT